MRGARFGLPSRAWHLIGAAVQASYSDVYDDQLVTFIRKRGADAVLTPPGRAPRTTINDVHGLATYWNEAAARGPGDRPGDLGGLDRARRVWLAEMALALGTPGSDRVYARNADFWHAMLTLSTELAALSAAPTSWELAKEAIIDSAEHLAKNVGGVAFDVGKYALLAAGAVGGAVLVGELIASAVGHRK